MAEHRAIRVRIAGVDRVAAVEDAARLRDALGVALPDDVPTAFTGPSDQPLDDLIARYARTHAPFVVAAVADRLGVATETVRRSLEALAAADRVVHGEFRPGGFEREWCDADVLRRIRRRSLAALRREIEPVDAAAFARFLPAWQAADRPRGGPDALTQALERLEGAAIPASILERDVLPARVLGFRPADLDALTASGDLVWVGAGALGADDGRVTLLFRDRAAALAPEPGEPPAGAAHDAIRGHLADRGASFWPELVQAAGTADPVVLLRALWDLVWAGEVTNDTLAPLRAFARSSRRASRTPARPRPGALRHAGPPAGAGRWSLVADLASADDQPDRARRCACRTTPRSIRRRDP